MPLPEILLYGDIGGDSPDAITAKAFMAELEALGDVPKIRVRINSDGGDVTQGIAIANAMQRHPATFITSIDGGAFSIAGYIAMQGDVREMAANGMLLIHGPHKQTAGTVADHEQSVEMLKAAEQSMAQLYKTVTGESDDEVAQLLSRDNWFTATEALDRGFITHIGEATALVAQLHVDKFQKVPKRIAALFAFDGIGLTEVKTMTKTERVPATAKELEAKCKGASADFLFSQLKAEATIEEATAEHTKAMTAQVAELQAEVEALKAAAAAKAMEEEEEEEMEKEEEAKAKAEAEKLAAATGKVGAAAVAVGAAGIAKSATAEWKEKVREAAKIYNGDLRKATSYCNQEHPELRERCVAEAN